ncbi:MAG: site-specific DNA-methyltransferase [Acidobacteriota bacterium]|nr:site-specific DNA-methyltransferase [Acidobacteriota bacterium]
MKPGNYLKPDNIYKGDARKLLKKIEPDSISLSVWSPPYHVGKEYEKQYSFEEWVDLIKSVIGLHYPILKPGAFLIVNIADILCFPDKNMPRIQAMNIRRQIAAVTREEVLEAQKKYPSYNRDELAAVLGCSEQTVDRRLHGNNIRGGKYNDQTRIHLVSGMIEDAGKKAGLFLYDRRVWVKDAAWQNSKWHTLSYRAVDEFEYLFFFWKPGVTVVNRNKLAAKEWVEWGSRAVWSIPSVRANDNHEAKFPIELPRRLIRLLTSPRDIVLDCFMGSGTTAVAAVREDRKYLGIELHAKYVEMAKKMVKEEMKTRRLFADNAEELRDLPKLVPHKQLTFPDR